MSCKRIALAILATTLAGCVPAQTNAWMHAYREDDRTVTYVDVLSISRNGSKVKAWIKWKYASPREASPKKTYLSAKSLEIYDCVDSTVAVLQSLRYADADATGEVVESASIPESQARFYAVAPKTHDARRLTFVCTIASKPE